MSILPAMGDIGGGGVRERRRGRKGGGGSRGGRMSQGGPGKRGGLGSGFESPDLERPGRQLHQQGLSDLRP